MCALNDFTGDIIDNFDTEWQISCCPAVKFHQNRPWVLSYERFCLSNKYVSKYLILCIALSWDKKHTLTKSKCLEQLNYQKHCKQRNWLCLIRIWIWHVLIWSFISQTCNWLIRIWEWRIWNWIWGIRTCIWYIRICSWVIRIWTEKRIENWFVAQHWFWLFVEERRLIPPGWVNKIASREQFQTLKIGAAKVMFRLLPDPVTWPSGLCGQN